jgi:hypothetical protein
MPKTGNPLTALSALPARLKVLFKSVPGWLMECWRRRSVGQLTWCVNAAGVVIAIGWFLALLVVHLKIITQPGPQEYNEPAIWHTTWLLDHGRNPYTANELPGAAYCFDPLYNYVMLALKPLIGIDYPAHRLVNLLCLLGSLGVLVRLMVRAGAGLGIALLSAVFFHWMCLDNIMITARPDLMGWFFFLLAIFVPWERNYTLGSTIVGLACALVAFHCKFYFALAGCATLLGFLMEHYRRERAWRIAGFGALMVGCLLVVRFFPQPAIPGALMVGYLFIVRFVPALYVIFGLAAVATIAGHFIVRQNRPAYWLGVGYFGALGLTFALCCHYFPYYYIETVVVQRGGAILNSRDEISVMHTSMLFARAWPFMLLMLYGVGTRLWRRQVARREGRPATQPEDRKFHALGAVFLIFLVIVYFYIGRNAGAYFTYHLHLLFPLMFVLGAYSITGPWVRVGFSVVLAGWIVLAVFVKGWLDFPAMPRLLAEFVKNSIDYPAVPPVPDATAAFRRIEQLIMTCHGEVLGIASTTDIFERQNRRVLHNGNTMFIGFAFADNGIGRDPMIAVLGQNYNATIAEVERKVAAREYAMVLTEFDEPYFCKAELVRKNYDKVEQIDYFTYFGHSPVRVWRPKPRDGDAASPP